MAEWRCLQDGLFCGPKLPRTVRGVRHFADHFGHRRLGAMLLLRQEKTFHQLTMTEL